jgi:hypothetical protein
MCFSKQKKREVETLLLSNCASTIRLHRLSVLWKIYPQMISNDYTYVGWGTGIAEASIFCSYVHFAGNKHVKPGI